MALKLCKLLNKFIHMYYQNVGGIKTKLTNLRNTWHTPIPDIFVLTETWLNFSINSEELGLSEYKIYRTDRNKHTSSLSDGGGVLIAVKYYRKARK